MTLPTTPGTFAFAVRRIADLIGYGNVAEIAGRTEGAIRKWAHEGNTACPTIAQALALDAAYVAAGGHGTPLRDAYDAQLELAVTTATACHRAFAEELAGAAREAGDAIAAGMRLTQPGASHNDIQRALIEADQAEGMFAAIKRRASSFLSPGIRPVTAKARGGATP